MTPDQLRHLAKRGLTSSEIARLTGIKPDAVAKFAARYRVNMTDIRPTSRESIQQRRYHLKWIGFTEMEVDLMRPLPVEEPEKAKKRADGVKRKEKEPVGGMLGTYNKLKGEKACIIASWAIADALKLVESNPCLYRPWR